MKNFSFLNFALFGILVSLSACATSSGGAVAPAAAEGEPVVIDVRTAEEYAESHLKGAKNIDVTKGDFETQVGKLDKQVAYKVYCRSGRRSGKALDTMKEAGFGNVENLGSLEQAREKLKASCEGRKPC